MATVPVMRTWVSGEVVTAAFMNANIRDNGNYWLTNKPVCEARQSGAQSIPATTWTSINFDTEDLDNDNMHSNVTNNSRFTIQTAGRYWFTASVNFASNNTGTRASRLLVTRAAGGSTAFSKTGQYPAASSATDSSYTSVLVTFMNVGDYCELQGWQTSGGALNTGNSDGNPRMQAMWLHTA